MGKNIVLCSDGTGNTPGKGRGTNVWKLYLAVDRHGHEDPDNAATDPPQVAFYDDGVGTGGIRLLRLAGGAFGLGLSRNILRLYASLLLHYEPGDKVFLFGFSRGAFTVRSLAGMISRCGLLERKDYLATSIRDRKKTLKEILRAYRSDKKEAGANIRKKFGLRSINIEFIGVWDTVDAVGLPFGLNRFDKIWRKLFGVRLWGFYDQVLSSRVKRACQALAIDDERQTFHPNVWEPRDGIEQVWFAGVHSNIGGGYPKEGLANIALYWMFVRARDDAGLRFVRDAVDAAHDQANAYAKLYDSRAGFAAYYRYRPRDIEGLCGGSDRVKVHVTALDRIQWTTDGYAPANLPERFEVVDPDSARKPGVAKRVKTQQARVDNSAPSRNASARAKVKTWVENRVRLYYGFLALSACFLLTLAAFAWNIRWLTGPIVSASALLQPVLGWMNFVVLFIIDKLDTLLSLTIGIVIPGFLAMPVQSLMTIPEIVTVFVLLGIFLLWRRQMQIRRLRQLGESMW